VSVVADALVRRTDVETIMMRPLTPTEDDYIYDLCRQIGRASQITSDAGLLVTPADVNRLQPVGRTRTPGIVQLQPTTGNDPKSEWLSWSHTC
jgi:hypothetical protein